MPRSLNRGIQHNITKPSNHQCETAPLAPNPVCERTNYGKNSARSLSAAADLSVIEKNQIPMNAIIIENSAGYS